MSQDRPAPPALSPEVHQVARGTMVNLAAMTVGAVLNFALTVLVSRWLQPRNTGAFFELIALFTIASATLQLGGDTGLTRWISRARAIGGLVHVRRIVVIAVMPVLLAGTVAAAVIWVAAPAIAGTFLRGMDPAVAVADVRIVAPLVPLGAVSACLLAGSRGYGRMWPYLAIEGFGKPILRMGLVLVALVLGLGLEGALIGWSVPIVAGLVAAALILAHLIRAEPPGTAHRPQPPGSPPRQPARPEAAARRAEDGRAEDGRAEDGRAEDGRAEDDGGGRGPGPGRHRGPAHRAGRPRERLAGEFWRFAGPRGFAGTFQIVVIWLDILLVGAVLSRYAAGVYGAVSKLALVGTFALEGTRLAIAPQLSALLARKEHGPTADLYQSATRWLMMASWPVYLLFIIFPAVVLGIFGHRYLPGASSLVVLSAAMLVNLGTGNVTVVLLMGGKSWWNAANALGALVINVGLNVLLLPRIGILGSAIAWAASIVFDNVAAVIEVWLVLRLQPFGPGYGLVVAATTACFGVTGLAARALLGQTLPALIAATAVGVTVFGVIAYLARARLQLGELFAALVARRPVAARGRQPA
jgi:O-antigen/teichoic acid export membrane protein